MTTLNAENTPSGQKQLNGDNAAGDVNWSFKVNNSPSSNYSWIGFGDSLSDTTSGTSVNLKWNNAPAGTYTIEIIGTDSRPQECCEDDYAGYCTDTASFTLTVGCELSVIGVIAGDDASYTTTVSGIMLATKVIANSTQFNNPTYVTPRRVRFKVTGGCTPQIPGYNTCAAFTDGHEIPAIWSTPMKLEAVTSDEWDLVIDTSTMLNCVSTYCLSNVRALTMVGGVGVNNGGSWSQIGVAWTIRTPGATCCQAAIWPGC